MRFASPLLLLTGSLLAGSMLALSCGGMRASRTPLGGKHEDETAALKLASSIPSASGLSVDSLSAVEEVPVVAAPGSASAAPPPSSASPAVAPAAAGAFQVRPYAAGQTWTRVFDAEFTVKVGPAQSIDMRMVNHQEARFEVLGASAGNIDKLRIEYLTDKATVTVMGRDQEEPQPLAGKRYVISFVQGKPEIRLEGGGTPSKKELDSVKDDAREPQAMTTAFKELSQLTAKGKGDFSVAGAVALAGGEDDDSKVTAAKGSLRQLTTSSRGEKSALLDLSYTLTSSADADLTIVLELSGTVTVLDAPSRYQTVRLQGPISLSPAQAGGMAGKGQSKVTLTYK